MIDQASFAYVFDPKRLWLGGTIFPGIIFNVTQNNDMMRDPRFPRLCSKLGLCDYRVKTDRWPDCAAAGVLPYDFKAEVRRLAA